MSESRLPAEDASRTRPMRRRGEPAGRPTSSSIGGAGFIGSHLRRSARRRAGHGRGRRRPLVGFARQPRRRPGRRRHAAVASCTSTRSTRRRRTSPPLITLRRPRQVVHLALLVPATTRSSISATRSRRCSACSTPAGRHRSRRSSWLLPATVLYGTPSARQLPAKEGEITPRGVAWRRRQGDRRPVDDVPAGAWHRVHGAGGDDGVRAASASPTGRRRPAARRRGER